MGNNPLWLGIQPAYYAAVGKTPAWGWEEKVRKMRGCFGLEGCFFLIFFFYFKQGNPKQLPEATEVTYAIQL